MLFCHQYWGGGGAFFSASATCGSCLFLLFLGIRFQSHWCSDAAITSADFSGPVLTHVLFLSMDAGVMKLIISFTAPAWIIWTHRLNPLNKYYMSCWVEVICWSDAIAQAWRAVFGFSSSGHPYHQMVWGWGGLQCHGDGATRTEPRRPLQLLFKEV